MAESTGNNGGRNPNGTFARGNKLSAVPRMRYSVTKALAHVAELAQSIRDDGSTISYSETAAEWLWTIIAEGRERYVDAVTGQARWRQVSSKDRQTAFAHYLAQVEPVKQLIEKLNSGTDDEADDLADKLDGLTVEQLEVLATLGLHNSATVSGDTGTDTPKT